MLRHLTAERLIGGLLAGFAGLLALVRAQRSAAFDLALTIRLQAWRHPVLAEVMRLVALEGLTTVSLCMGSRRWGAAAANASCIAILPASRNANSELSTL